MTHNIFGDRFLGTRTPAWHQIGTVLPEPIPAMEAIRKIEADFRIEKAPLTVKVETLAGVEHIEVPGKFAIVREPTDDDPTFAILGMAGNDYEVVQRRDFASALDRLTPRWPLETIGVLGQGETVFFTLDAGLMDIGGEEVHQYFLVFDKVDGKTSAKIAFTPVRVVCQNTLTSGLSQATMTAILDHRTGINQDFNFRIDLIEKMADAQRLTMNTFELMTHARLTSDQIDEVFEAAYPHPSKPKKMGLVDAIDENDELLAALRGQGVRATESYDYYCQRADGFRQGAREMLARLNDGNGNLADSAWYVWNAVTELADWRDGSETVPVSTLFGPRAVEKKNAFKVAVKFLN